VSTATENQQPASSFSSLRRFVARCPVAAFLVMLYTVTWIIFLPVVLQGRGLLAQPIGISEGLALNVVVFAIASMLGVALSAFLVTAATGGKAGVRDLLRRCLRWRVGLRWYLIALFGLLVTMLLGASVFLSLASLEALAQKWPLLFTLFLPEVLLPLLFIQIFEEAGWTGFMQHTIQSATGPCLPASWRRPPSS
jgi:CAAX protease family protein